MMSVGHVLDQVPDYMIPGLMTTELQLSIQQFQEIIKVI